MVVSYSGICLLEQDISLCAVLCCAVLCPCVLCCVLCAVCWNTRKHFKYSMLSTLWGQSIHSQAQLSSYRMLLLSLQTIFVWYINDYIRLALLKQIGLLQFSHGLMGLDFASWSAKSKNTCFFAELLHFANHHHPPSNISNFQFHFQSNKYYLSDSLWRETQAIIYS